MKRLPRPLDPLEVRVLGALLEKEQATPAYYPMTVNSLVQACNQKTNRSPVMELSADEVQATLDRLFQEDVFAWRSRAGRAVKWKQNIDRRWHLGPEAKAVMTLLMLRGPQTAGELRARAARLHEFADLAAVERALESLGGGEEPMVRELPRQPGQKESRWTHLLGDPSSGEASTAAGGPPAARPDEAPESAADGRDERIAALEKRVAALEGLWAEIARQLAGVES